MKGQRIASSDRVKLNHALKEYAHYREALLHDQIAEAVVQPETVIEGLKEAPVHVLRLALAFMAGDDTNEAAKRLGVDVRTVRRWQDELLVYAVSALTAQGRPIPGRGRQIFERPACPPASRKAMASSSAPVTYRYSFEY